MNFDRVLHRDPLGVTFAVLRREFDVPALQGREVERELLRDRCRHQRRQVARRPSGAPRLLDLLIRRLARRARLAGPHHRGVEVGQPLRRQRAPRFQRAVIPLVAAQLRLPRRDARPLIVELSRQPAGGLRGRRPREVVALLNERLGVRVHRARRVVRGPPIGSGPPPAGCPGCARSSGRAGRHRQRRETPRARRPREAPPVPSRSRSRRGRRGRRWPRRRGRGERRECPARERAAAQQAVLRFVVAVLRIRRRRRGRCRRAAAALAARRAVGRVPRTAAARARRRRRSRWGRRKSRAP